MNIVLWVITAVLAIAFLAAGAMKLVRSRAQLATAGMGFAADATDTQVKAIGALEVLGALGLLLPALLNTATILVPLAALGLALLMAGAVVVHLRRGEGGALPAPAVLGVLALVVAVLRFGPLSF